MRYITILCHDYLGIGKKKNVRDSRTFYVHIHTLTKQTEVLGYKDFLPTIPQHRHLKLECWSWLIKFKQKQSVGKIMCLMEDTRTPGLGTRHGLVL